MVAGGALIYWALGGGKLNVLGGTAKPTTSAPPVYGPAVPTGYVNHNPASGAVAGPPYAP